MSVYKFLLSLSVAVATVASIAEPPKPPLRSEGRPILPRIELLSALGASQRTLVADYYWIRTIQQVGAGRTQEEYRDVYFYANHATDLDPLFYEVYPFAAVGITHNLGREQWVNTDESTALLRKGVSHFENDPQLQFLLAFNLMYYHQAYVEAAGILEELAKAPNAPSYLSALATRLYAQGGSFDVSLQLAEALRDEATDQESREMYEQRILQIQQEQVLQRVDMAVATYRARHQKTPENIEALIESELIERVPQDPLGGTIYLDERGRGQSDAVKHRLRLIHVQPQFIQDP